MISRIPHMHESTITTCQFNISDDRIITTSTDKTTKFFDLVSHRSTMTLRYNIVCFIYQSMMQEDHWNRDERLIDERILVNDVIEERYLSSSSSSLEVMKEQ